MRVDQLAAVLYRAACFSTILLFVPLPSTAQEKHTVDSLRLVLREASTDSTRFKCLLAMAAEYIGPDPDSAYFIRMSARAMAALTGRPDDMGEVEG